MREFSMSPEDYQRIAQDEYSEAKNLSYKLWNCLMNYWKAIVVCSWICAIIAILIYSRYLEIRANRIPYPVYAKLLIARDSAYAENFERMEANLQLAKLAAENRGKDIDISKKINEIYCLASGIVLDSAMNSAVKRDVAGTQKLLERYSYFAVKAEKPDAEVQEKISKVLVIAKETRE